MPLLFFPELQQVPLDLAGDGLGKLLPEDNLPRPGDLVVTSGVGLSFPKGIPIGIVRESTRGMDANKQYIILEPRVDFQHLEYVIVLRYKPQAAEVEGRRQVEELMNFFHKYVPGCEKATLMGTGSTMGIRESRHVHGDFVLPVQDLIDGVIPDDNILLSANSIDVHGAMGGPAGGLYMPIQKDMYGVPYRCLLPAGVGGLLLAGRCISADSAAAGAIRVMPPAMAIGQAAGTAAALCLLNGTTPSSLDYADLRNSLLEQNVFLG